MTVVREVRIESDCWHRPVVDLLSASDSMVVAGKSHVSVDTLRQTVKALFRQHHLRIVQAFSRRLGPDYHDDRMRDRQSNGLRSGLL